MSDTALVVMARYPERGRVKTRLARSIGEEATCSLYQAFLGDLAQRFTGWLYDLHWAYTPAESDFAAFARTLAPIDALSQNTLSTHIGTRLIASADLSPSHPAAPEQAGHPAINGDGRDQSGPYTIAGSFPKTPYTGAGHYFPQQGQDLGARLQHAFHFTRAQNYPYTVLIGSDSPHISRTTIVQAREALESADVVLGPAEDGGYYLLAMREPHDVFSDIQMSTPTVLRMTIEKAQSQGLTVRLLEPLLDVDEVPELLRLAQLLQKEPSLAPVTAACLAEFIKELVV